MIIMLILSSALAQDLPATACEADTEFCAIHKDRLATLLGKAKASDKLRGQLIVSADKIDELADELQKTNDGRKEDGTRLLAMEKDLIILRVSETKAKRSRNVAYTILTTGAVAVASGVFIGTKL